ncbi:MAG: hypothetical protein KAQ97_02355, partial [Candidatus Fermentibacteraceae bacterium]|nr:hypothetical protein [Candidatus Fermentibacteraceae bacterium]
MNIDSSNAKQRSRRSSGGKVVVYLAIIIVLSVFLLISTFGVQLVDDGYYYLEIARNISCGNGFTFDGVNRTNGFHPLWQIMLVPVFLLTQSRGIAAQAVTMLQTLLFAASGFVLYRILLENTKKILLSVAA